MCIRDRHQYDFWKAYNHIRIEETPDLSKPDPSGCGVPGQIQQRIRPSARDVYKRQGFLILTGSNRIDRKTKDFLDLG